MASTAPFKGTPTSINYASLSSYLSLPSTIPEAEADSPSTPVTTHIRTSLTAPPNTNNIQADRNYCIQSNTVPSSVPSTALAVGSQERQRLLRQNQEIIRLCSLRSIQIRQSETRLSQLESENIGLRATVNKMQRQMEHKTSYRRHRSPISSSHSKSTQSAVIANNAASQKDDRARAVRNGPLLMDDPTLNVGASGNVGTTRRQSDTIRIDSGSPTVSKDALLKQLDYIQTIYESQQEALCKLMESFSTTSLLFKNTLQLVEVATLKESQSIEQISSTAAVPEPMTITVSPRAAPRLNSPSWKQRFLAMSRERSPRSKWTESFSPTHSSPLSFFSTELLKDPKPSVTTSPLCWTKYSGQISYSPPNLISSPIPQPGQCALSEGHLNILSPSKEGGHDASYELIGQAEEGGASRITKSAARAVPNMSTLTRIAEQEMSIEEEVVNLEPGTGGENLTTANVAMVEKRGELPASASSSAPTLASALLDVQGTELATRSVSGHSPNKSPVAKKPKRKLRATQDLESRIPQPLTSTGNPHKRRRLSAFMPLTASPMRTHETPAMNEKLRSLELTKSLISRYKPGAISAGTLPVVDKRIKPRTDLSENSMELDTAQPPSVTSSNRNVVATPSPYLSFTYRSGLNKRSKAGAKSSGTRGTQGQSTLVSEYLKTLTPDQLLKKMTKSLLGSSKAPVIPRSMVNNVLENTRSHRVILAPTPGAPSPIAEHRVQGVNEGVQTAHPCSPVRSLSGAELRLSRRLSLIPRVRRSSLSSRRTMNDEVMSLNQEVCVNASLSAELGIGPPNRSNASYQSESSSSVSPFAVLLSQGEEYLAANSTSPFMVRKMPQLGQQSSPTATVLADREVCSNMHLNPARANVTGSERETPVAEQGQERSSGRSRPKRSCTTGSLTYKLPPLRRKLYQGDPGTYSMRTPRRSTFKSQDGQGMTLKSRALNSFPNTSALLPLYPLHPGDQ